MLESKLDILNQKWIDVVFTDRNKAYGAYELRKENGRNSRTALLIGVAVFVVAISANTIINAIQGFIPKGKVKVKITNVILTPPPPDPKKPPPPPPPVKELEVADPGQKNLKGDKNADVVIDEPVGTSDQKVTEEDPNKIFTSVEQQPTFPNDGFNKYLGKNIVYPAIAKENGTQGKVILQFVVERDGSLTDIKVLRGIGDGCDEEAVRVLKKSPHWTPGIQNGRPVRCTFTVPISFTLGTE